MNGRRHLRLVSSTSNREPPRQMVLVFAGLDNEARGAETEPIITANDLVAAQLDEIARSLRESRLRADDRRVAQLEAIARSLRASIPRGDDRRAG